MRNMLTPAQRVVLRKLDERPRTVASLDVRSDVLWRLETSGYIFRSSTFAPISITDKGRQALHNDIR